MKANTIVFLLAVLLAASISGNAQSGTKVLMATGTEQTEAVVDPGQWSYAPSGNIHIRGYISQNRQLLEGPGAIYINGDYECTMNLNLDKDGYGPMWGTCKALPNNPPWEALFEGKINGFTGTYEFTVKGFGFDDYEGLRFESYHIYTGVGSPSIVTKVFNPKGW